MPNDKTIRLVLDVTPTCEAPTGTLTLDGGAPVAFSGWLDLLSALQGACSQEGDSR